MTSKIKIYNGALGKIGVERIAILTEDSDQRIALDDQYETALNSTLEAYAWKFAQKRVQLAVDSASPAFGFDNQFPLPSDLLKINTIWNGVNDPDDIVWEQEGQDILTDEDTLYIIYTYKVTNEGLFTNLFAEALHYQLASLVSLKLKNNRSLAADMITLFDAKIIKAETQDAKRQSRRSTSKKSSWITARGATTTIEPAQAI